MISFVIVFLFDLNLTSKFFNIRFKSNNRTMSKRQINLLELAPQIQAVIILDSNGNRLCAKYYSNLKQFKTKDSQTKFESAVLAKANRSVQRSDSFVNKQYIFSL